MTVKAKWSWCISNDAPRHGFVWEWRRGGALQAVRLRVRVGMEVWRCRCVTGRKVAGSRPDEGKDCYQLA
jgi:hypothetical protein